MLKLREHQCSQYAWMFLGSKISDYLSVIVDNGTLRLARVNFSAIRNWWLLPKSQINIKSFVQLGSYGNCIHHYSDCVAALTDLCHKNVLGNVVDNKVTKTAIVFLKHKWSLHKFFWFLNQIIRQNVLLQVMQTKLLVLEYFSNMMSLDL